MAETTRPIDKLISEIRACRRCVDDPLKRPLPHEPRPVLRVSPTARIAICGQAPGTRVHASGIPFTDPSGDRLHTWMGVTSDEFYDARRIAIIPMGFCFPGLDAKGSDLPPRPECAPLWRQRVLDSLPQIELMLLVGTYAQRWHLGADVRPTLTETVQDWSRIAARPKSKDRPVTMLPLPHPSWRNTRWIKDHPWFAAELLPRVQRDVRRLMG